MEWATFEISENGENAYEYFLCSRPIGYARFKDPCKFVKLIFHMKIFVNISACKYFWEYIDTHSHYYWLLSVKQTTSICNLLQPVDVVFLFFCFHSKSTKSVPIGVPLPDTKLLTSATSRRMLTKDLVIKWTVDTGKCIDASPIVVNFRYMYVNKEALLIRISLAL